MKILTPWIVPNKLIQKFCNNAFSREGDFYIESILRHDDKNYCVVINGSYPFIEKNLERLLENESD
jgi:hypothetical protein